MFFKYFSSIIIKQYLLLVIRFFLFTSSISIATAVIRVSYRNIYFLFNETICYIDIFL